MFYQALKSNLSTRSSQAVGSGFLGMFGNTTANGQLVNSSSALTLSAFYNGIEILCNDFAKLPKSVYQKTEGDRKKLDNHNVTYLIAKRPNNLMTAFMFDKMMLQYAILKGNAYAIIQRNSATQKVEQLHLVDQQKTPVVVKNIYNRLWYQVGTEVYADYEMLHVPGFSFNGITGVGVVTLAANSLGVALASQNYAAEYYESKGDGLGIITSTKPMDPDAKIRLSEAVTNRLSQKGQTKVTVLDEAGSFQHIKLTPQESQFLQTNASGILEVARWLNVPPHKLKSLENASFSNIEHQEISHISDSILPWALKFQNEYDVKLFVRIELDNGYSVKFNTNSLLRADLKTQAEYFSKLIHAGVLNRNEVRLMLERNRADGLDDYLTPVNAQTLEQIDLKLEELKQKIKDVA